MDILRLQPEDKLLIVSPHPDDESIGCGGLLLRYGAQCDVVLVTNGERCRTSVSEAEIAERRLNEFNRAMRQAGVHTCIRMGVPDGEVERHADKLLGLALDGYSHVFIPNIFDSHPDHCNTSLQVIDRIAMVSHRRRPRIYLYEVWSTLWSTNTYVDISDLYEEKKALISEYASQLHYVRFDERILSLNHYRGMSVNCQYAECYFELDNYHQSLLAGRTLRKFKKIIRAVQGEGTEARLAQLRG